MSNVEQIYTDKDLTLKCARLLGFDVCDNKSKADKVVLLDNNVFDPINNIADWGVVINTMLLSGFDFALDQDGIIVHGPAGMVTFNDENIGRRLTKSFVELSTKIARRKEPAYATK